MDDPTTDAAELRRTMYISALWFAAAVVCGTVTTAILMASGWRPYRLTPFPETAWVIGAIISVIGTVLLAWAGCPVTSRGLGDENKRKTLVIRLGIVAFMLGIALASVVELLSPVYLT
jgi:multisubunit Na+/H+ antiporter MnhB subunit